MSSLTESRLPLNKEPEKIAGMFNKIASRYDMLNHLLSAGLDRRWRRTAVRQLDLNTDSVALDLCTGTADLARELVRNRGQGVQVVGVDFSAEMLCLAHSKIRKFRIESLVRLIRGDAEHIPLGDFSVDGVSVGFGVRNILNPECALKEVYRVLRPGGRLVILEFGEPKIPLIRYLYLWYFRNVLPLIGSLVSRDNTAYSYLPASVGTFHSPEKFCEMLKVAGFTNVQVNPLSFGIVYMFSASRS
tara:strand:+ start:29528 stop:30262 length:735 start_codon:yes stop_codon:yes gene_type:complete